MKLPIVGHKTAFALMEAGFSIDLIDKKKDLSYYRKYNSDSEILTNWDGVKNYINSSDYTIAPAIPLSMGQQWLREYHNIYAQPMFENTDDGNIQWVAYVYAPDKGGSNAFSVDFNHDKILNTTIYESCQIIIHGGIFEY